MENTVIIIMAFIYALVVFLSSISLTNYKKKNNEKKDKHQN